MPKKNNFNFEKSLTELESITEKLDSSTLPLEGSLKLFEQGITLAKQCEIHLKSAEQQVEILTSFTNEEVTTKPFDVEH